MLSDELLARRKERRIARKEPTKKLSLKKLPPKKGFGAAKPVKQETRGLNGDDLIWDLSEREEYVRTMREQFEVGCPLQAPDSTPTPATTQRLLEQGQVHAL